MFLEQNRIKAAIVVAAPRSTGALAAWRRISALTRVVFLLRQEDDDLADDLSEFGEVLGWDHTKYPAVSGNIKKALEHLELEPHEAIYVTEDRENIAEAISTRVGVVKIGDTLAEVLPDLYCTKITDLEKALEDRKASKIHGYVGEVMTMRGSHGQVRANVGWVLTGDGVLKRRPHLDRATAERAQLAILGRYFPTTDDRHRKHQFSQRILGAKRGDLRGAIIAEPLAYTLDLLFANSPFDLITRVPPRPSKADDHLSDIITVAINQDNLDNDLTGLFKPSAIECVVDYAAQKTVGAFELRAENVAGAFRAKRSIVAGKSIVLIDDVLTSGSTVIEAAKALFAVGAVNITILVFGMDQRVITANADTALPCPKDGCNGRMSIRYNSNDDGVFWGCSAWSDTRCDSTMKWLTGMVAANKRITRDLIPDGFDIEF